MSEGVAVREFEPARRRIPKTTIAIVDAQRLFREGFRALLSKYADLRVVAEASTGREGLNAVRDSSPDVVVIDLAPPDLDGIHMARELTRKEVNQRILALSMVRDEQHVAQAFEAGVLGYATKEQPVDEVVTGIRAVAQRQHYLAPGITQEMVQEHRSHPPPASLLSLLTATEREIFALTARGMSSTVIALQLYISKRTVETHWAHILRKVGGHSTDQVRLAVKLGVLPVECGARAAQAAGSGAAVNKTTFRIPEELLKRLDAQAVRLSEKAGVAFAVTKTDIVKVLLLRGLDAMDSEAKTEAKRKR